MSMGARRCRTSQDWWRSGVSRTLQAEALTGVFFGQMRGNRCSRWLAEEDVFSWQQP